MYVDSVFTVSHTVGGRLEHSHDEGVVSCGIQRGGVGGLSSTSNCIGGVFAVPLVGQVRHVVVTDVSDEGNFTTFADVVFADGDVDVSRIIDVDIERSAFGGTTIRVVDDNGEDVRVVAYSQRVVKYAGVSCAVDISVGAVNSTVEQSPFEGVTVSINNRVVQVSSQNSRYGVHTGTADDRVARDFNRAVRIDMYINSRAISDD